MYCSVMGGCEVLYSKLAILRGGSHILFMYRVQTPFQFTKNETRAVLEGNKHGQKKTEKKEEKNEFVVVNITSTA